MSVELEFSHFPRGDSRNDKTALLASASWHSGIQAFENGMIWLGRDAEGNPVGVSDDRHVFTGAGNRSGKGTSFIVPNLFLWPGSAVVIDPKGENAAITAMHRVSLDGHHVVAVDPFNEANLPSELIGTFNPLDMIDIESDDAIDIAGMIADSMIVKANAKDMHWDESARDIITAIILHVCDTEDPDQRHLGTVRQLLTKGDPGFRDAMLKAEAEAEEDEQ